MGDADSNREALYAAVEPHRALDERFTPDVNETGDGFAVWDSESGDQVRGAASLDEAIALARQMNEGGV